jgi:hypothetical protein
MSRPNWVKQAVLAAVLLVLALGTYWLQFKHKPEEDAKDEAAKKIFALKDNPSQLLKIVDGKKAFELSCLDTTAKLCKPGDNSKWQLLEPLKLKADDSNTNSFLSTLNNLNVTSTIDIKTETPEKRAALLKEYGLDSAALSNPEMKRVEVTGASGTTVLYLGLTHPIGETIFATVEHVPAGQKPQGKADESTVYLVPTYFKTSFDHDLTYWRDKKLLTVASHEVIGFKISSAKGTIDAVRDKGQWTLTSKGVQYAGDTENIESLLSGAQYLVAKSFASNDKNSTEAKEALKGTKEVMSLTLQKESSPAGASPTPKQDSGAKPEPVTVTFYKRPEKADSKKKDPKAPPPAPKEKLYATVSNGDPLYELDPVTADRFVKELKDLRLSKLITSMDRFTAKKIEFTGKPIGDPPLVLNNKDGKWTSVPFEGVAPERQEVDTARVADLLDKLSGNRIRDFLSGSAIPAGQDDGLIMTIYGDDPKGGPKRKLVFWKKGELLYARNLLAAPGTPEAKEAMQVDPAVATPLPWLKMSLFKVPPLSVTSPVPGLPQSSTLPPKATPPKGKP